MEYFYHHCSSKLLPAVPNWDSPTEENTSLQKLYFPKYKTVSFIIHIFSPFGYCIGVS